MSIKQDNYSAITNSNLLHSYYAVNSVDGQHEGINNDPNKSFYPQFNIVSKIHSFVSLSIQHLKELLQPKLIRSFDAIPVQMKNKRF